MLSPHTLTPSLSFGSPLPIQLPRKTCHIILFSLDVSSLECTLTKNYLIEIKLLYPTLKYFHQPFIPMIPPNKCWYSYWFSFCSFLLFFNSWLLGLQFLSLEHAPLLFLSLFVASFTDLEFLITSCHSYEIAPHSESLLYWHSYVTDDSMNVFLYIGLYLSPCNLFESPTTSEKLSDSRNWRALKMWLGNEWMMFLSWLKRDRYSFKTTVE